MKMLASLRDASTAARTTSLCEPTNAPGFLQVRGRAHRKRGLPGRATRGAHIAPGHAYLRTRPTGPGSTRPARPSAAPLRGAMPPPTPPALRRGARPVDRGLLASDEVASHAPPMPTPPTPAPQRRRMPTAGSRRLPTTSGHLHPHPRHPPHRERGDCVPGSAPACCTPPRTQADRCAYDEGVRTHRGISPRDESLLRL